MRFTNNIVKLVLVVATILAIANCASTGSTDGADKAKNRAAQIRLELATEYYISKRYQTALNEIESVVRQEPSFADAYNLRGLIYMELSDFKNAEINLAKALALNRNNSNIGHNYAWLLCRMASYDKADVLFAKALQDPMYQNKQGTYYLRFKCLIDDNKVLQAQQVFEQAQEHDLVSPRLRYEYAKFLFKYANYIEAQQQIRSVNNSQYADEKSLWLGIKVERQLGQQQNALQLAQQLKSRFADTNEYIWYQTQQFDRFSNDKL